jgi:RHS repeat-associated protein
MVSELINTLDNSITSPTRYVYDTSDNSTVTCRSYSLNHYIIRVLVWLSRDPIEEKGGVNLYVTLLNDLVNKVDPFGLFGRGQTHKGVYFKGHSDFVGNDIFDYNKEDDAWDSNPLTPWGMHRHFHNIRDLEIPVGDAVEACDKGNTERLLHQWQDTYVHWDKGWRWWKLGHAFARVPPDLDNDAWKDAEFSTDIWVEIWKETCCKSKDASDGWIPKDGSEGCCDKD